MTDSTYSAVRRTRWEYFVVNIHSKDGEASLLRSLDDYGREGWEMVGPPRHTWGGVWIVWLKRRVLEAPP